MWEGVVNSARHYLAGSPDGAIDSELVEDLIEAYLCWKETSLQARMAYECWRDGERPGGADAYGAYCAALDQEEGAARHYRSVVVQLRSACS